MSTAAVANAVDPAVVDINVVDVTPSQQPQAQAAGTGMILTPNGEVLTNNHVVENAVSIKVTVAGRGVFGAKVIGVDPTKDVALLQLEGVKNRLPTVTIGNSSKAVVGTSVVAIGNAMGLGHQPTVVTGAITATGRTIQATDNGVVYSVETLHNMLETDANIVPGDSGGPLVTMSGQVIGMDTAGYSSEGGSTIGFAIPINSAISLVGKMAKGQATAGIILGESSYLGIFQNTGSSGSASNGFGGFGGFGGSGGFGGFGSTGSTGGTPTVSGVSVSDVAAGGPAYNAGIRGGDTITALDGKATASINSLKSVLGALRPGDKVSVSYVDPTGASHTATVTIGSIPK